MMEEVAIRRARLTWEAFGAPCKFRGNAGWAAAICITRGLDAALAIRW
jgi:hypothetical protein